MKTILLISIFLFSFSTSAQTIRAYRSYFQVLSFIELTDLPDSIYKEGKEHCFLLLTRKLRSYKKSDTEISFKLKNGEFITVSDNGKRQAYRDSKIFYLSEFQYNRLKGQEIEYIYLLICQKKIEYEFLVVYDQLFRNDEEEEK